MGVETIGDVLHWARNHHQRLSEALGASNSLPAGDERAKLLLSYLSVHESRLTEMLEFLEESGDLKALNTHCYDYLDKSPFKPHPAQDASWAGLDPADIMVRIEHEHNQLIALYRHLRGQVDRSAAQEMLDQLIALEEHEAMSIAQGANRLNDY